MIRTFLCANNILESPPVEKLSFPPPDGQVLWVDFESPTKEESELLTNLFRFDMSAVHVCVEPYKCPMLEDYHDYFLIATHCIKDFKDRKVRFAELDILVGKNYVVTYHDEKLKEIDELSNRLRKDPDILQRGSDLFLSELLDFVATNYLNAILHIDRWINELEEKALTSPTPELMTSLSNLRRVLTRIRRIVLQQSDVLRTLILEGHIFISKRGERHLRDAINHFTRVLSIIESDLEAISGVRELYMINISNRTNEIIKVLTVIATIMMPLTLITGIYGMNFQYMPELQSPYGYPLVLLLMAIIAGTMLGYFKKKRWI